MDLEDHITLLRAAWWARRIPCPEGHRYAAYLPRCPWCPPIPKHKGA
jgi:hypothetical protein